MRTILSRSSRPVAAALAGALVLTSLNLAPAQAAASGQSQAKQTVTTEFSARRHWRRGNAAVLGAVAGVFGAIAIAAANERYRDDYYGYYGNPYYGGYPYGGPYYYGGYGYRGHHHWHHH